MSKRNNKRKKDSSHLWGSQNSSILDFFSQEHAAKMKKTSKLDQDFQNFGSFTSSFDNSQRSNATIDKVEGLSLNTQEATFDVAFGTQNSHAWSEVLSDIGDSDLVAPFLFDLDDTISKNATDTDSVVSNFSDNSQPVLLAEDLQFNNVNENQRFNRESSVNLFVSNAESPVLGMSNNDILPFDDDDGDCSETVTSSFSTQELLPPPQPADEIIFTDERSNDSMLPPLSDFQFIIPASTAVMQHIAKEVPKPVTQHVKKEGLTDIALKTMLKGIKLHEKWEDAINAQLAKYGNIAKVCKEVDPEAALFWIIDSWIEGGLIFAWCTLMDEEEIEDWITMKQEEEEEEEEENADPLTCLMRRKDEHDDKDSNSKAIKRCPDAALLAATEENGSSKPEENYLFAFSLAYINSRQYAKRFVEEERVVAVWPDDWSELPITLPKIGHCTANLTSKFKADSIY